MAVDENSLKLKTNNKISLADMQKQTFAQLDAIDSSITTLKKEKARVLEGWEKFKKGVKNGS